MSRETSTIARSIIAKLPVGWAFGRRGGVLDTVLAAGAQLLADSERAASDLMDQTDPRNARELLDDFERVLGPDACGRDTAGLTVSERQAIAHQRWTAFGGQDIPYLTDTAAKLGEAVEIIEFWPSRSGGMQAGDILIAEGEQFLWVARMEVDGETTLFRAGASSAGDRLGTFTLSASECELRRIRPAHTEIVFSYVDYLTFDGEPVLLDGDALCLGA
jgi:uncharacterized protein YmfQ (DUF2313 family)